MNPMIHLARFQSFGYHPSYGGMHSYAYHSSYGGGWMSHMIVSSIIHGLIYSVIFRLMNQLSLGEAVLLAVVVIAVLYGWNRRGYRRW